VQGSRLRTQRAGQNLDYPDPKIASVVMTDKKLFFATLRVTSRINWFCRWQYSSQKNPCQACRLSVFVEF